MDGKDVGVQNPLHVDGDSVHASDVWVAESEMNGFSGAITDLFDNLHSVITDATATNPKHLLVHFNRSTVIQTMSLGAYTGDFSNVKVSVLKSNHDEVVIIDESTDNTKYNSRRYELPIIGFYALKVEFYTADQVSLSNFYMAKVHAVSARIQGQDDDGNWNNVGTTPDGDLTISDNSSGLSIAQGRVSGTSFIHKFGNSPKFNKDDGFVTVWDGADDGDDYESMQYIYSATADIDTLPLTMQATRS